MGLNFMQPRAAVLGTCSLPTWKVGLQLQAFLKAFACISTWTHWRLNSCLINKMNTMPQIIIPEDRNFFSAAAKNSWAIYILTVVCCARVGGSVYQMIFARLTEIIFKTDRTAKTCNSKFLLIYCSNFISVIEVKLHINT